MDELLQKEKKIVLLNFLTKQINLENPAGALKVLFAAHRPSTSDIKVLYKILRTDDSSDFDDLGYTFFNSTGVPDTTVAPSLGDGDYSDYEYTGGTSEEGTGEPLDEFIAFQIKIICNNFCKVYIRYTSYPLCKFSEVMY